MVGRNEKRKHTSKVKIRYEFAFLIVPTPKTEAGTFAIC